MSIVINGSGTISGISVGGLPDSIVDAGTLATNSVDSAELINGAVDDSHIAALAASKLTGALPAISGASLTGFIDAQMPSGSVIQIVSRTTVSSSGSSSSWAATDAYVAITPSSTSSKILVICGGGMIFVNASDERGFGTIYRDSTNLGNGNQGLTCGYAGSSNHMTPLAGMTVLDSPSTTSAVTYKVYSKSGASSPTFNYDTNKIFMIAMEIKG